MSDALRISKMHAADPYCRGKGVLDCGGIRGYEVKRSQLSSAMPIFRARPGCPQDCSVCCPPGERSMNRTTWLQGPKFRDVLAAGNARSYRRWSQASFNTRRPTEESRRCCSYTQQQEGR